MAVPFALILCCYFVVIGAQQNGDVRLVARSSYEGRVEIYLNGQWGTVRYNSGIDQHGVAQAICRQLGFWNMDDVNTVSKWNISEADSSVPTLLANVNCEFDGYPPNAARHILRCYHEQDQGSGGHSDDMAVRCVNTGSSFYDGDVQLVDGKTSYRSSGYVEIYFYDSFGGVCNMGQYDADSACRQLGYTNAIDFTSDNGYTGNDKLDSFTCWTQSYSCLYKCFSAPAEDVNIDCDQQHSYVTCTFDESKSGSNSGGSESQCSLILVAVRSFLAIAIGVVLGLLLLITLACVGACLCCCCIPGCILYNSRSRGSYRVINS